MVADGLTEGDCYAKIELNQAVRCDVIHSFLLIGQSNMGGRGYKDEVEPIDNDRIMMLRNGRFIRMFCPVNCDRAASGVNLAESFADLYSREHNVDVGLIPCADGGSSLDMWQEGSLLFDHACYMAELASRTSTIVGVLWHQGESDSSEELYPHYEEKLKGIIAAFRKRLGLDNVPFILGGLGDFIALHPNVEEFGKFAEVNEALEKVAEGDSLVGFASAKGLGANPDNLHFSARALRELGMRYYQEYSRLAPVVTDECAVPVEDIHTALEML